MAACFMTVLYILIAITVLLVTTVFSFTFLAPTSQVSRCHHDAPPSSLRRAAASAFDSISDDNANKDILLVSVDGVVVDTVDWRIQCGIHDATTTWPHLRELLPTDTSWLVNKLQALSHCMTTRPPFSQTCDYALLTRLLLEEQELDQGRSVGKSGMYASRFHPSSGSDDADSTTTTSTRNGSSRPLTVGEIQVNWSDGACLSDTLLTKYNIDGNNPLPILQENIEKLATVENIEPQAATPQVNKDVCEALSECSCNVILRLGHESDLESIQAALKDSPLCNLPLASTVEEALSTTRPCLLVDNEGVSETQIFRRVLDIAPAQSTLYVVDHSWNTIRYAKILFGDYIPRIGGKGRAAFGEEQNLSLNLWSACNSVSLLNSAEMDPWTNVMDKRDLMELTAVSRTPSTGE